MGYRMSKQFALGDYSPYLLMFGRHLVVGATLRDLVNTTIDLDNPRTWAEVIAHRAEEFRKAIPIAFSNLQAAQHRDTLWYAKPALGKGGPTASDSREGEAEASGREKM